MRKINIYVTYDEVAQLFHTVLLYHINDADAKRSFEMAFNEARHARKQDWSLYHIGEYDRVDGKIDALTKPRLVMMGIDIGKDIIKEEN